MKIDCRHFVFLIRVRKRERERELIQIKFLKRCIREYQNLAENKIRLKRTTFDR